MINVTMQGDKEFLARLKSMPRKLNDSLFRAITGVCISLEAFIKDTQLSGGVLNVQTGDLRRSINHEVQNNGNQIIGEVFSAGNIPYAKIQEYGGTINHPGGTAYYIDSQTQMAVFISNAESLGLGLPRTKAHKINIPEHSYMRSGLAEKTPEIQERISAAIKEATA